MKFIIRHADRIVGLISLIAITALLGLIVAIGSQQNWFEKKYVYRTQFETAQNVQAEMSLLYKGFTIGKVKKVELVDNQVWVEWYIQEKYIGYATYGSLVELAVSPIGLGTQFIFHPGKTQIQLTDGCEIFRADSKKGVQFIEEGLTNYSQSKDSISGLILQVGSLISNINDMTSQINAILKGKSNVPLAQLLTNVVDVTKDIDVILKEVNRSLYPHIEDIIKQVSGIIDNINELIDSVDDATGSAIGSVLESVDVVIGSIDGVIGSVDEVISTVDGVIGSVDGVIGSVDGVIGSVDGVISSVDGVVGSTDNAIGTVMDDFNGIVNQVSDVVDNVNGIVTNVNGIVTNVNGVIGTADNAISSVITDINGLVGDVNMIMGTVNSVIDNTTPQLNTVLTEVNTLLIQLQDVMEGLKNNPLLKNGISERASTGTALPAARGDF